MGRREHDGSHYLLRNKSNFQFRGVWDGMIVTECVDYKACPTEGI